MFWEPWILNGVVIYFSSQFSSVTQSCLTLCSPMDCSAPGFPVLHYLPELAQTHVNRVHDAPNHLILCPPLFLLPSIIPSNRVFYEESVLCIRWPKHWSFSFSSSHSNEYSGLISFRMDSFHLLAVQGTLKSLLQHHSSKSTNSSTLGFLYSPTLTSIHDYRKNHGFDWMDLGQQVMSLLFNMLSRLVIDLFFTLLIFLPWISWPNFQNISLTCRFTVLYFAIKCWHFSSMPNLESHFLCTLSLENLTLWVGQFPHVLSAQTTSFFFPRKHLFFTYSLSSVIVRLIKNC